MAINNTVTFSPLAKPKTTIGGFQTTTPQTTPQTAAGGFTPFKGFLNPQAKATPAATATLQTGTQPTQSGVIAPPQATAPRQVSTITPATSTTPVTAMNTTPQPNVVPMTGPESAPSRGLFSNVASSLATRSVEKNDALGAKAQEIADLYGREYASIGRQGANAQSGYLTTGTSPVATGNAAVIAQNTAAQQSALAQGAQAALTGIDRQLAAQGQSQSGQSAAAGLAKPTSDFPFVFDPTTGSFSAAGAGTSEYSPSFNPATDSATYADAVINHRMSYADALNALQYAGPSASNFLNQAILGKGGNPTQLQAQTGVQTAQTQQVEGYRSALQQGQNLQSQLKDLITTFGLNPNDLNAANIGLQKIATNVSSPQYQQLQNYINDIANTYSQILTPPGGSPTDTTRSIATSMLDATAKGQSIIATMESLDQAAQAKIAGVSTIQPSNGSGGFTVKAKDGNQYGFYQDANGVWHAQ